MLKTTYNLLKNLNFYKNYVRIVSKIKITNRINSKLEIWCRYLRVPREKDLNGNNFIICDYGQDPDLRECIECQGIVNLSFKDYENNIEGLEKKMKDDPKDSNFYLSSIKYWEDKIIKEAKKRIEAFLTRIKEKRVEFIEDLEMEIEKIDSIDIKNIIELNKFKILEKIDNRIIIYENNNPIYCFENLEGLIKRLNEASKIKGKGKLRSNILELNKTLRRIIEKE